MSGSKQSKSEVARGTGGGRSAVSPSSLAGTQSMTATQIALGAGQGLARWPVPPGYKPLTDEDIRRSSANLFSQTTKTGMVIGIGAAILGCLLMGLGFLLFGITGGAVAAVVLMLLEIVLSLTVVPQMFEKLNDSASVKIYRDAGTYVLGYFYGWAMGNLIGGALLFPAILLLRQ